MSPGGGIRITGGYLFSGWYNVVRSSDFIRGVQNNNFAGLSDTLSFDGLVTRLEFRF